jgi:hypothetical protein
MRTQLNFNSPLRVKSSSTLTTNNTKKAAAAAAAAAHTIFNGSFAYACVKLVTP